MSCGPIPWTAINEYAIRFGYGGELYYRLLSYVEALDSAFLKNMMKKRG